VKNFFIVLIIILISHSCKKNIDNSLQEGIVVNFILSTTNNSEQDTTYADFYINTHSISMFVYDINGYFKDKAIIQKVTETDNNTCIVTAYLNNITEKDYSNNYRVVIIANTNSKFCNLQISDNIPNTLKELYNNLIFNYASKENCTNELTKAIFLKDKENGTIPFWGTNVVKFVNNGSFEVNLLRSLAKIMIFSANESVSIEKVELSGGTNKGYIAPYNAWEMNRTIDISSGTINVPELNYTENLCTEFYNSGNFYYLYVPEQHAGDSRINIIVNGKTYSIFIGDLNSEVYWPIIRNTIYSYSINLKESDTKANKYSCITIKPTISSF
jgi:hypothetical protein